MANKWKESGRCNVGEASGFGYRTDIYSIDGSVCVKGELI